MNDLGLNLLCKGNMTCAGKKTLAPEALDTVITHATSKNDGCNGTKTVRARCRGDDGQAWRQTGGVLKREGMS